MQQNEIREKPEIFHLYIDFLAVCLKTYSYVSEILDLEVKKQTKGELEDGWLFFLLMFSHGADFKKAKDLKVLKEYIQNLGSEDLVLTAKGQALLEHLDRKIELHSSVLRFNGVSLYDLVNDVNSMTKMLSFWKAILKH